MLTSAELNVSVEIKGLIEEILQENSRYNRDLRSFHRGSLVCPVVVKVDDEFTDEHHCVSRNISPAGICIISQFDFQEKDVAMLELYRISDVPLKDILAECRWCKPFGATYWMSGWQFVQLQLQ